MPSQSFAMLSVLIPVFNFDVRALVQDLHRQLVAAGVPFEIICFDDDSTPPFKNINRALATRSAHIRYVELPHNVGRARIRNLLAAAAQYPWLLFMDCDSKVVSNDYIQQYISHLQSETVLCGGRCYAPTPPSNPDLYLHWLYGRQREQISADRRQQKPWHAFMSNNFLVPKAIFDATGFDERIVQYGHEDTLLGLELQQRGVPILHLDNPLEHLGLETNSVFLDKTRQGIQSLVQLLEIYPNLETKLLRSYQGLRAWRLATPARIALRLLQALLLQNLRSRHPWLRCLDLYKLLLLLEGVEEFTTVSNF
ncbi:MAG TPA: glycosyltransferase family 2 protein [Saprospiraceae bacterium]|nr:glycosyltransferase family 2 protein [Saprospiraceae bacterium]HMP23135.1 glycosyltransferase family 2 protein [Saprospiraceae bacterium]